MSAHKDSKIKRIAVELIHHLPFSMFGVMSAILLMGFITYVISSMGISEAAHVHDHGSTSLNAEGNLFHVFHSMHVLISAVATTAMFWKHDNRNVFKAFFIGLLGSITICGLSDMIVPYVGGQLLGTEMHLHICIIEEPMLVWPFAIIGVLAGFTVTRAFEQSTQYSHAMHVFISSVASLLYLMSFGLMNWMPEITGVFLVTLIAVMLPCCLSDIVFPMVCTHKHCSKEDDEVLHHH